MVTRLYTPYQPAYVPARPQQQQRSGQPANNQDPTGNTPAGLRAHPAESGPVSASEPGLALATVAQHGQQQRITLQAILNDFRHTAEAIGADETVQRHVHAYLQVARLQAQGSSPNIPLIRHMLGSAAQTLDAFITQALKEPSAVVTDWVKALLNQPIDYGDGGTEDTWVQPGQTTPPATSASQEDSGRLWQQTLQKTVQLAQQAYQNNQLGDARQQVEAALAGLQQQGHEGHVSSQQEARLFLFLGAIATRQKEYEPALAAYAQAAARYSETSLPDREVQVLRKMAELTPAAHPNDPTQALQLWEQISTLERALGNTAGLVDSLDHSGQLAMQLGQVAMAQQAWAQALRENGRPDGDETRSAGLLKQLATAHLAQRQPEEAIKAYQLALRHHFRLEQRHAYVQTLSELAQLYSQLGRPAEAEDAMARAQKLRQEAAVSKSS
jgi:tetratricopeptide (TPR) repeat protein